MKQQYLKAAGAKVSAAVFFIGLALPTTAVANHVHLWFYDGSARIAGELLSYSEGRYRLETKLGVLLISANVVACEGAGCPSLETVQSDLLISGDLVIGQHNRSVIAPVNKVGGG